MIEIRDKTFDPRFFGDVIEAMDAIYIMQKVEGRRPEYYVDNAGRNSLGYIHQIVIRNTDTNTGFSLFLYEDQTSRFKGYFRFQFKDPEFNARKNASFLKSLGIEKWDKKRDGIRWSFAIYLTNLDSILIQTLASAYVKYIL